MKIELLHELDGSRDTIGYWAKGEHDPVAFVEELALNWFAQFDPARVRHEYWRKVPALWYDDPPPIALMKARGPGRGAFQVTVVERDW